MTIRMAMATNLFRAFVLSPCVFTLILLFCVQPAQALRNVKPGEKLPPFSLQTLDGKTVANDSFKGKTLVILFARPGQADSVDAVKTVQRVAGRVSNAQLSVLIVSTKPGQGDTLRDLARKLDITWPIALDPQRKMYGDFGLIVSPTTLLIDNTGVLRFEFPHLPPSFEHEMQVHLEFLLGKITEDEQSRRLEQKDEAASPAEAAFDRQLALAGVLVKQRKFELAISILIKLRTENRDSIPVATLLGTCYLKTDQLSAAAECLDPLIDQEPAPPSLKLALARLEARRGNDEKAESFFLAALENSPEQSAILYELGRLYEAKGKNKKALACYRKALDKIYGGPTSADFPGKGTAP